MKKLRIAVVTATFPLLSETFILNQITGLLDLGHDVDILALHKPPADEPVHDKVQQYHLLSKTRYFQIPKNHSQRVIRALRTVLLNFLFAPLVILKCLDFKTTDRYEAVSNLFKLEPFLQRQYDIIHIHFGTIANEFVFLKDLLPRSKIFVSFHGHDIRLGLASGPGFYQNIFSRCDTFLSPTQYCKHVLTHLSCPENKIIIHPNGVDTETFKPLQTFLTRDHLVITTTARLHEDKNLSLALEIIYALVYQNRLKVIYNIIGEGPKRYILENEIAQLQLKHNVHLLGALTQKEVIEVLRETDIFLLTSRNEGFGLSLIEAQSMGIPVVASMVGGVVEALVHNKTGFVFNLNNPQDAVLHLLTLIRDKNLRDEMGRAGRKFVEETYASAMLIKRLEEIYMKACP